MPWRGYSGYLFTRPSVFANAPTGSGVYALWAGQTLVYVGESDDLQRRLLEHLTNPGPCLRLYAALAFGYEVNPTVTERRERRDELIAEFNPACNAR